MSTELSTLSENAQRWVTFFRVPTRRAAAAAIEAKFIAVGSRPGLTKPIFDEINQWANGRPGIEARNKPALKWSSIQN